MFKIFGRNNNIYRKYLTVNYKLFSSQPKSKVPELKWTKPENLSPEEERKYYENEFEKIYKIQDKK